MAVSSLFFTFSVVHLIKKELLELKYSLLWLFSGVCLVFLAVNPLVLSGLADLFGIADRLNMLFLAGNLFLIAIVFSLTVALSRSSRRIRNLTQETALLKIELERLAQGLSRNS
jgi:hypothetical protein